MLPLLPTTELLRSSVSNSLRMKKLNLKLPVAGALICLSLVTMLAAGAEDELFPRYKPSSRSAEPVDIRTNAYGASRDAPAALSIGERVADFVVPRAGGGVVSLGDAREKGGVAIIFYRGHW